ELSPVTKARLMQKEDAELAPPERYPVFKIPLADTSPGGYCLDWAGELPVDIKTGDIVGLKEEQDKEWVIAVIRWLGRPDSDKTLIGLELLSPRAVACGARIHQKAGEKAPPIRVLLLPEIKLVGQPQTLITPRTGFKERQKVTVGNFKQASSIQLTRHIASTGSFSQFEFRYITELGDVLANSQNGQLGADFDSLWSSI
ncbi:MAG TPA: GTPase, partial [Halioglobus sp.]